MLLRVRFFYNIYLNHLEHDLILQPYENILLPKMSYRISIREKKKKEKKTGEEILKNYSDFLRMHIFFSRRNINFSKEFQIRHIFQ